MKQSVSSLAKEYDVPERAIQEAYFIESTKTYSPAFLKKEFVADHAKVSIEMAEKALKAIWEKVFISD